MANFDFAKIRFLSDKGNYKIPFYYNLDNYTVGASFKCRVTNVFDPSKFWIVTHCEQLDTFYTHINELYSRYSAEASIKKRDVRIGFQCIAFVNQHYYRADIISLKKNSEKSVGVYLVDFGAVRFCHNTNIFYLHQDLFQTPRFAIRARLDRVIPITESWSYDVAQAFLMLVYQKDLEGIVTCIDVQSKALFVHLSEDLLNPHLSIKQMLITNRLAKNDLLGLLRKAMQGEEPSFGPMIPPFHEIEHDQVDPNSYPSYNLYNLSN